jgi:hypothetical protein
MMWLAGDGFAGSSEAAVLFKRISRQVFSLATKFSSVVWPHLLTGNVSRDREALSRADSHFTPSFVAEHIEGVGGCHKHLVWESDTR